MSERNDGGPAFPYVAEVMDAKGNSLTTRQITEGGMSLRDHFAGLAMQAILTRPAEEIGTDGHKFARFAYQMADAMITERDK